MPLTIRDERESDIPAIRELAVAAFSKSELGYHGEAEIVARLRAKCPEILSLIAEEHDRLRGHILFSPVKIASDGRVLEGMGLAPLSVLPGFQRQGIGSRLVEAGLKRLAETGCPFVVVLGHPEYYGRFGFEPAGRFGITSEFTGVPEEVFRIKPLSISPADLPPGLAKYRDEFSEH